MYLKMISYKISLVFVVCVLFLVINVESRTKLVRNKRGASIYPVFGSGSSHGGEQSNYLFQYDASPFISYVGGPASSSGHGSSSGNSGLGSSYRTLAQPRSSASYDGTGGGYFDNNYLNSFSISQRGTSNSGHSAGRSPGNNLGYSSSSGYTHYGLVTPNFANNGGGSSAGHMQSSSNRYSRAALPSLDANVLLYSARASFDAQNSYLNALNSAGPHAQQYKGGLLR